MERAPRWPRDHPGRELRLRGKAEIAWRMRGFQATRSSIQLFGR
jgi:hypothetical protein